MVLNTLSKDSKVSNFDKSEITYTWNLEIVSYNVSNKDKNINLLPYQNSSANELVFRFFPMECFINARTFQRIIGIISVVKSTLQKEFFNRFSKCFLNTNSLIVMVNLLTVFSSLNG